MSCMYNGRGKTGWNKRKFADRRRLYNYTTAYQRAYKKYGGFNFFFSLTNVPYIHGGMGLKNWTAAILLVSAHSIWLNNHVLVLCLIVKYSVSMDQPEGESNPDVTCKKMGYQNKRTNNEENKMQFEKS